MHKIKPVENLSLVDKVEINLLEYFKSNKLQPGDAIPKEIDFANSLGVSRTVVREALLRLRTLGLIESKKHRGMVLTEPNIINSFERIMDPTLLGMNILKNLFELRLILEMGMADFLFARKTQKDLDEMEEIVEAEERSDADKHSFSLDREIAFHGKLYQMSNNKTLQRFQHLLLPAFEYVYLKNKTEDLSFKYSTGKFTTHRMLLDNIKVGTPETFRNAMRQHLEPHFVAVLENGK
ncbi:FCD domain-containing protein [Antarcticibacterium sp. 1MA-6-2]|uniref:FadR/GntR family transcriptional regulator n=1 Tax=Antarcticibacterium sp. 1MA-6-2 TaxID=2908210 RepID=UPI001F1BC4BC|nr:FCD domain-containing protein [Antarcticibacterium sp. 1MA-6-2]UJH92639.1 FCD domain-containing protein [Antarcticibacterium sp. 1MA-6-2]